MTNKSKSTTTSQNESSSSVKEWETFLKVPRDVSSRVISKNNDDQSYGITMTPHPRPSLPNEVISAIFNYISSDQQGTLFQCTLVNKQFNVNATRLLWETIVLDNDLLAQRFLYTVRDAASTKQQRSIPGQMTRSLVLTSYVWRSTDLTRFFIHMPNLEHFKLSRPGYITDLPDQHEAPYIRRITKMELYSIAEDPEGSFSAIGKHCHSLTNLEYQISDVRSVRFLSLLQDCPSLKQLTIIYSDRTGFYWYDTVRAIQGLRHLTRLKLVLLTCVLTKSLLYYPTTTNNNSTTSTGIPWPRLQHLTLESCGNMKDALLIGLIKSYPTLEILELHEYGKNLTDTLLDDMAPLLPKLTRLVLHGNDIRVPYSSVRRLIHQCRYLTLIDIGDGGEWTGTLEPFLLNNGIKTKFMGKLDSNQIDKIRQ